MPHQPANTDRNRRLNKLAGATTLGVELSRTRIVVNSAIAAHRKAQAGRSMRSPVNTRRDVLKAVAAVRNVEARVEAKYGSYGQPVAAEPAFLMAAE